MEGSLELIPETRRSILEGTICYSVLQHLGNVTCILASF